MQSFVQPTGFAGKLQLWFRDERVRCQVKAHAHTQVETSTKLSKSNDIMLKQPVLITLPILLMAWMRSFLSKNRQSLHTHSTMLEKQWVILQHSVQTQFPAANTPAHRPRDSLCSGTPFWTIPRETSSSLKHICLEQLCLLGLHRWILFLAFSSVHKVGEAHWHRWKHRKGGFFYWLLK